MSNVLEFPDGSIAKLRGGGDPLQATLPPAVEPEPRTPLRERWRVLVRSLALAQDGRRPHWEVNAEAVAALVTEADRETEGLHGEIESVAEELLIHMQNTLDVFTELRAQLEAVQRRLDRLESEHGKPNPDH